MRIQYLSCRIWRGSRLLVIALLSLIAASCGASPSIDAANSAAGTQVQAESSDSTSEAVPTPVADISRDDAIAQLSTQAFLSFGDAACVIDTLHAELGVYDFTSAIAIEEGNQPELIERCVNGETPRPSNDGDDENDDDSRSGLVVREVQVDPIDPGPFELTEASAPAYTPGALASGSVELDGRTVEYVTVTPAGFEPGAEAPVLIALPPGGQDLEITSNVAEFVYVQQAVERGWVVVSPASPGGRWWDAENVAIMPEMIRWIEAWVSVEGGQPHLAGMSNGGKSAFSIATERPSDFASLMVYPGAPDAAAIRGLDGLTDMPVRMWVGGDDAGWVAPMDQAAVALAEAGGDVELKIVPGEPHVIQSITDGIEIFDQLDAARSSS